MKDWIISGMFALMCLLPSYVFSFSDEYYWMAMIYGILAVLWMLVAIAEVIKELREISV